MKISVAIVLAFVMGLFFHRSFITPPKPLTHEALEKWSQDGIAIAKAGKDPAEQLKLAEEYYGKAVVLFLGALAIQAQAIPVMAPSVAEKIAPLECPEVKCPELPQSTGSEVSTATGVAAANDETKNQKLSEKDEALQKLFNYKRLPYIDKMTPTMRRIQGNFEGEIVYEKNSSYGKRGIAREKATLSIDYRMVEGKIEGNYNAIVYDASGKPYSNSRGSGGNKDIKIDPQNRSKVYLEVFGGGFYHLNVNNNPIFGECYDDEGLLLGKVRFNRI